MTELTVAVATPLPEDLCQLIEEHEPRVRLLRDQTLLPPERWYADFDGDPSFSRSPSQQKEFEALLDSADVLYGIPDVSPRALARTVRANPRLRWVHTMAAGGGAQVKAADLTAEELERVTFTTSAGVHAGQLAEFALLGLLAGAKNLPRLQRAQRRHRWEERWAMGQISEQTTLVLGLGHIGREFARKAAALGMTVIGTSRHPLALEGVAEVVDPTDTEALARAAANVDSIVVTLPGTAATEKLLSARVLAGIKPGTTIASVGRGTVIDQEALIEALRDGRIGFAALDVFASEPLPADSPLWDMDNVLISPHTAANSPHEERLIAELFADNARRLLDGDPLRNVVNTHEFY